MDNNDDIYSKLKQIVYKTYKDEISKSEKIKRLIEKIRQGKADYRDMLEYSEEIGECAAKAFRANVSDSVLPDKKMKRDLAEILIDPICKNNYDNISNLCVDVQTALNKKAGIGMKGVKPDLYENKIQDLIDYISQAEKYSDKEKSFLDSLVTNSKSIVDESVRVNADFHYKSGMSPMITRIANGETCEWCTKLAGTYKYSPRMNRDVFKRHPNCNCQVIFDPANGSKKIQYSKTNETVNMETVQNRINTLDKQKIKLPDGVEDVTKLYLREATPSKGEFIIEKGEVMEEDINTAKWIQKNFGGNITALRKRETKFPDSIWRNQFWEFKTPKKDTSTAIEGRIRKGVHQIRNAQQITNTVGDNSGIVLDLSKLYVNNNILNKVVNRYYSKVKGKDWRIDLIIKYKNDIIMILRNK